MKILLTEDGTPSEIAEMYRQQFEEILVDEYQDTNRVQEKLFLVSNVAMKPMGIYLWLVM